MCGLIVIAGTHARMTGASVFAALRHRGPDSHGYESVAGTRNLFEFGHTRLAIQDLSPAGAQPMWSADRRWLLAFNGEIYNQHELRRYLERRHGTTFRGHSDTEALLELIAREGVEAAVARLDGMFAFVVLDRSCDALYAVRDTAGVKPLYYSEDAGGIAFSSEVRGLTAHGYDLGGADSAAAASYLRLRYVPSSATLFERLRRVPPGTVLRWQGGTLRQTPFHWNPAAGEQPAMSGPAPLSSGGYVAGFGKLLEQSVQDQLLSDVPVGVLLSGGLDSAVLASALKKAGVTPPCFTVGFESDEDRRSEITDAAETASLLGLPHYPLSLTVEDLLAVEERVVGHLEEPLGTTSVLAMWHLCALARTRVTVALAGQGADEPLGGYRRHRLEALRSSLPLPLRKLIASTAGMLPLARAGDLGRAVKSLASASWLEGHLEARQVFSGQEVKEITGVASASAEKLYGRWLGGVAAASVGRSDLNRSLWLDARTQLADDLLLYGDKISMAHSLEVRVPFLAAPLLAAVEQLPDHWRTSAWQSKRILRAWAREHVPAPVLRRRKRGFQIPNVFKNAAFLRQSKERAVQFLGGAGIFAGWDTEGVVDALDRGSLGGPAEVRAWTLHSLARWAEIQQAAARPR